MVNKYTPIGALGFINAIAERYLAVDVNYLH
jgi:hypothetical protein